MNELELDQVSGASVLDYLAELAVRAVAEALRELAGPSA